VVVRPLAPGPVGVVAGYLIAIIQQLVDEDPYLRQRWGDLRPPITLLEQRKLCISPLGVRTDNTLKVRFSATLGQESWSRAGAVLASGRSCYAH
jgi:hypothetical protein